MVFRKEEALQVLRYNELLKVGIASGQLRNDMHPGNTVTYALRAPIGLSLQETVREAAIHGYADVELDSIADRMYLPPETLTKSLVLLHDEFPQITYHHLPLSYIAGNSTDSRGIEGHCRFLYAVGLRSLRLDVHSAQTNPHTPVDAGMILRAARELNIGVHAALTIGEAESPEQRLEALSALRVLQEETGAIQSVFVRVHHAATPEARREEEATAVDYLKTLAVTRLFLDNIAHIQTDWSVMGPKVLELALRFGADDAGSVPWSQTGNPEPSHHGGESELRRIIRDAGFRPVERDALFCQSLLH